MKISIVKNIAKEALIILPFLTVAVICFCAPSAFGSVEQEYPRYDVYQDGEIDIADLVSVGKHFGEREGDHDWDPRADVNRDGEVDILDLTQVGAHFGETVGLDDMGDIAPGADGEYAWVEISPGEDSMPPSNFDVKGRVDYVFTGDPMIFNLSAQDEGQIRYEIDWGDNSDDPGNQEFYDAGVEVRREHYYEKAGTYDVQARAFDETGNMAVYKFVTSGTTLLPVSVYLSCPEIIEPWILELEIKSGESIHFGWKEVVGATKYQLRLLTEDETLKYSFGEGVEGQVIYTTTETSCDYTFEVNEDKKYYVYVEAVDEEGHNSNEGGIVGFGIAIQIYIDELNLKARLKQPDGVGKIVNEIIEQQDKSEVVSTYIMDLGTLKDDAEVGAKVKEAFDRLEQELGM